MDSKQYIESGILEEYVLGRLSEAEQQEVEGYAKEYPEIRAEIEHIELALERYAQLHAVPPPAGTLTSILTKTEGKPEASTTATPPASKGSLRGMLLLTSLLLLLAAALAIYFWLDKNSVETENAQLQQQLLQEQSDCDTLRVENDILRQRLLIIRNSNERSTYLKATENAPPDAIAAVYRDTSQQQAYLDIINLPPAPAGKKYQLWAIVDGAPADMGVFELTVNNNGFINVPYVENAQAFAVTLEDENDPEPTVPNLDQLYVIGNVS